MSGCPYCGSQLFQNWVPVQQAVVQGGNFVTPTIGYNQCSNCEYWCRYQETQAGIELYEELPEADQPAPNRENVE